MTVKNDCSFNGTIFFLITNEMYGLENWPIYEEITWFKIFLIRYENLFTERVFCEKFFKNKHTLKKLTLCFTEIE